MLFLSVLAKMTAAMTAVAVMASVAMTDHAKIVVASAAMMQLQQSAMK
jgi:hypothetical protein